MEISISNTWANLGQQQHGAVTAVNVLHWYRASWSGHSCGRSCQGGSLSLLSVLSALLGLCSTAGSLQPTAKSARGKVLMWQFLQHCNAPEEQHQDSKHFWLFFFFNKFDKWNKFDNSTCGIQALSRSLSQDSTEVPVLWVDINYPCVLCFLSEDQRVLLVMTGQHLIIAKTVWGERHDIWQSCWKGGLEKQG